MSILGEPTSTTRIDFETLEEIKDYIFKEFENLNKNKNRPRSQQGIFLKTELLNDAFLKYETIVQKYENLNDTNTWNTLTDNLEIVRRKYEECLKILSKTKHTGKTTNNQHLESGKVINLRSRRVTVCEDSFTENFDISTLNVSISETDLYFGPIRDPNILSSTLYNADYSDEESKVELIKSLHEFSTKFDSTYKSFFNKMAYVFPTEKAIQVIPEFRGAAAELDAFIYQIKHFAEIIEKLGENDAAKEAETELIHVVLSKLKGPAAIKFKNILADTWEDVRDNLRKEFGSSFKLEELFQKIETLEQGQQETFQSYKDRVLQFKKHIEEYEKENFKDQTFESYAQRSLRIHFLAGLKNRSLKNLAKTKKDESLEDLIDYLEEECIDVEQIEQIERRLQDSHIAESQRLRNKDQNFRPPRRNFDNRNKDYDPSPRNYQRRFENNRNQGFQEDFNNDYRRNFNRGTQGPQGGFRNEYRRNDYSRGQNDYRNFNRSNNDNYPRNDRNRYEDSYRDDRNRLNNNTQYRYERDHYDNYQHNRNDNQNTRNEYQNTRRDSNRNEPPRQENRGRNDYYQNSNQNVGRFDHPRENNWNNRNFGNNQERKN